VSRGGARETVTVKKNNKKVQFLPLSLNAEEIFG
jgi:hypothetical protein